MKHQIKALFAGAILTGSSLPGSIFGADQPSDHQPKINEPDIKRPNIILIMTDQHNAQYLSCLGRTELKTPNFDAFAKESVIFHSAYSPSPVCGPSRAAIFTGQYPLQNGIYSNWIPLENKSMLLTKRLAEAGYYNIMIGKLHLTPVDSSHGFQSRRICDSPYDVYDKKEVEVNDYLKWAANEMGISQEHLAELAGESERTGVDDPRFWLGSGWTDDKHQMTTWTGNEAVSFIRNYENKQPFFLHISFFGPHHPYSTCEPWNSMYDPAEVSLPPTMGKIQPGKQPGFHPDWPEALWREIIAKYSGNISAIDVQIGRIIASLKEQGLWENTLIVFTSDHGDHMGDFSQLGKGTMLESSVRVPFIIKPPGHKPDKQEFSEVINLIDLYSTFLDYAGVTDSSATDSRTIRKLITGDSTWQNQTFSSLCSHDVLNGQVMFIKNNFKCVGFLKDGNLEVELYDRTERVPDLQNLSGNPEYMARTNEMKAVLQAWLKTNRKN